MYELPQAGKLANELLQKRLGNYECHETKHATGLWNHTINNIVFTLFVDDFEVTFKEDNNLQYLIDALQTYYEIESVKIESDTVELH